MKCADIEELVQQRLDGASAPLVDESHLSQCAGCRELWSACGRLEAGLQQFTPPEVPPGLGDRVVFQFLLEQRQARRRTVIGVTALAASMLLVAFLLRPWADHGKPAPVENPPPIAKVETPEPPSTPGSVEESVGEASAAIVALVGKTAGETVGPSRLLMPDALALASNPMTDTWSDTLVPPAEPLREAGRGVSAGLEPVASSARRAVNLFWRDLPPMNLGE